MMNAQTSPSVRIIHIERSIVSNANELKCRRLFSASLLMLVVSLCMPTLAQQVDSYVTEIVLPMDLHTEDGTPLPQGHFHLEVQTEKGEYALFFSRGEQVVATVKSQPPAAVSTHGTTPLVGTLYLRSTALPLGTAEERQLSKTGRPQYQDEDRDWNATLRVYKSSGSERREVYFVFQERAERGEWKRTDFKLLLENP